MARSLDELVTFAIEQNEKRLRNEGMMELQVKICKSGMFVGASETFNELARFHHSLNEFELSKAYKAHADKFMTLAFEIVAEVLSCS
jgi:hypothetical protein